MKKYSIFSLIFIGLIALFVYMQNNATTTFTLFGVNITLQNAIWMAVFLGLFYIVSILFFSITHIQNFFYKKNIQKDIDILINNIKNRILYIDSFKDTKLLNYINNFIKNINGLEIEPNKIEKFDFLEDIQKLKNGETIQISKYKLKEHNPWYILNIKNRLHKEKNYAKEVLKKFKNEELKKEAFYIFAKNASINEILKYDYPITKEIILSHINDDNLKQLLKKANLNKFEEIEIAKKLYNTKTPDKELEIISPLKYGYAYLALKYEHLEKAKEIIEENNLKIFEYFIKLREHQKIEIDEYLQSIS